MCVSSPRFIWNSDFRRPTINPSGNAGNSDYNNQRKSDSFRKENTRFHDFMFQKLFL